MSIFDGTMPLAAARRQIGELLAARGVVNAAHEARLLLQHALGISPAGLSLSYSSALGERGALALDDVVQRRLAGEPVARILGTWEFWSLSFALSPATLVPRPDTEILVERALALVADRDRPIAILDLGTGSGCIIVALLSELPAAAGIATDRSYEALSVARRNAIANSVGKRAGFVLGDWCTALGGPFDLIVSNPPYIARAEIASLDAEVREHDPHAALDGGPDGLAAYRTIIAEIAARPALLAADGAVLFEVGYDQADEVRQLGMDAGFTRASIARDLAGHERVVTLRPPLAAKPTA